MIKLAASIGMVALISSQAFAQAPAQAELPTATPAPGTPSAAAATPDAVEYVPAQARGHWLASALVGATVRSSTGDHDIGKINDLLVDKEGRVVAAVIGVGGLAGIGEKNVAVPFGSLALSNERDRVITLAVTRAALKRAPEFRELDGQAGAGSAREGTRGADSAGAVPPAARPPETSARPTAPAQ